MLIPFRRKAMHLQTNNTVTWKTLSVTCLLLANLLGACIQVGPPAAGSPTQEATPASESEDHSIVVALSQAPVSLDPADHRDRTTESVIRNMFDGLVTRDTRNGVHLELAEELKWHDDQTLEIELRQGVLFQ